MSGSGRFVDFSWGLTAPAPILCQKVVLYAFVVEADLGDLTKICESVFDAPSGGAVTCKPIDKKLILQFGYVDWIGSGLFPEGAGVTEQQVLIRVPVSYSSKAGSGDAYFTPFIGVDNPLSMAGGREVFGYPKTTGCFDDIPLQIPNPLTLSFKTWRGDDLDKKWVIGDQIVIQQGVPSPPSGNFIEAFLDQLDASTGSRQLFKNWLAGSATEIFLKQFRAIESTPLDGRACFQQIATAQYSATPLSTTGIGYSFDVEIADFDSGQVVTKSGLKRNMTLVPHKPKTYHTASPTALRIEIKEFTVTYQEILWPRKWWCFSRRGRSRKSTA